MRYAVPFEIIALLAIVYFGGRWLVAWLKSDESETSKKILTARQQELQKTADQLSKDNADLLRRWQIARGDANDNEALVDEAWTIISNARPPEGSKESTEWRKAMNDWRDKWYELLRARAKRT